MPLLLLFVVFIVVPVVELWAIIQVGQAIGVLPTLALLVLDSVLGTLLMRSQGRAVWRRFNAAIAEGRAPAREVIDGGLVIVGGAFLLTPGFVTDLLGVVLLLPPTRAIVRRLLVRGVARRFVASVARPGATGGGGFGFPPRGGGGARGGAAREEDFVEGSAREVDPKELP